MGHCGCQLEQLARMQGTYVFREVTHLVALAALHSLRRAWLRAFLGVVTFLFAVLASVRVNALFRAIASAVALFGAVYAHHRGRRGDMLRLFLLAVLEGVSHFLRPISFARYPSRNGARR